jgi:hypothetical protein
MTKTRSKNFENTINNQSPENRYFILYLACSVSLIMARERRSRNALTQSSTLSVMLYLATACAKYFNMLLEPLYFLDQR